ncbi:MAG: hypothetical protein JST19_14950 [Bacteroidetes bacterium]|nr:hypothetical protein [Bacteroidota bacterium]
MTGVFITARLGSTRLAQKHLIQVNGRSFIEWLAARLSHEFSPEIGSKSMKIFITTSVRQENKKFDEFFSGTPIEIFYGSDENIPLRHLECAEANGIENIISIDGDDILCSTQAARQVMNKLLQNSMAAHTVGLPLGMNVSGYQTGFLKESLEKSKSNKLETGWGKIFDAEKNEVINIKADESGNKLRMTLDYPDDSVFFEKVIAGIGDEIIRIDDAALIDTILKNEWYKLNDSLSEEYWENFNKKKQLDD